ncbi:ABC transporter permease [Microbacterium sp. NPDC076911]|uniref:ABC transporter permease n=1 Tax=Microbacterium sp. NPDC076911 TaxID=3154958 RepID=UPI00343C251B
MSERPSERYARLASEPLIPVTAAKTGLPGVGRSIREIYAHRHLLGLLVRRDVKSRYKDSALGLLWTLINPIVQLIVYYTVMGQFLGAARGIDDFALYIFSGLTIFVLFSEIVSGGTGSIVNNAGLVKKVYVPREIFPLASVGSGSFTFAMQVVVLTLACVVLGAPPFTVDLFYFLPSVLLVLVYGTALALLLSAMNVYLRDMQYLTQILLMLSMWSSPIVYGWTMVRDSFALFGFPSWAIEVYSTGPLTLAVLGFHKAFWVAGEPTDYPSHLLLRMVIVGAIGIVLLWLSQRAFTRMQGNFAQEL